MLHVLARQLLHIGLRCLLLRLLHLEVWALCLKVWSLHLECRTLTMQRRANHVWASEQRSWLRQARPGVVAS
jgi:hypothetical protein